MSCVKCPFCSSFELCIRCLCGTLLHLGLHPLTGCNWLEVILTSTSADALAKVEDLETWTVPPTMVRGSKAASVAKAKAKAAPKVRATISKAKANSLLKPKFNMDVDAPEEEELPYRRTKLGREQISAALMAVRKKDWERFPSNPVFGANGECRMKFDGAQSLTVDKMCKNGGIYMEALYRHLRKPQAYSSAVSQVFDAMMKQLDRNPPSRQSFLRITKDIGEFIACHKEADD